MTQPERATSQQGSPARQRLNPDTVSESWFQPAALTTAAPTA